MDLRRTSGTGPEAAPRLLFLVSEDWYFLSHRLHLAKAALAAGFEVALATRVNSGQSKIEAAGIRVFPLDLHRSSRNPILELAALKQIMQVYLRFRPHIVHHVALKPSLYGSVAAKLTGVPAVINALAGLGYVFTSRALYARLLRPLVLRAFKTLFGYPNTMVVFQNADDRGLLVGRGTLRAEHAVLIRGAGVDIDVFSPTSMPEGIPVVVFPARMLFDKGLQEFVDAAGILKRAGCRARFALVGEPDPHNPATASPEMLQKWVDSGTVEWWARRADMPEVFRGASLVCLPSYREGLPKALLEAAACARPIVATDVPGCREVVVHGENGLLVPPHDASALADAIARLLGDPEQAARMGVNGRQRVERTFSEQHVAIQTLGLYKEMLSQVSPPLPSPKTLTDGV